MPATCANPALSRHDHSTPTIATDKQPSGHRIMTGEELTFSITRLRFDDVVLCTGPRTSLRNSVRSAVERCPDPSEDRPLDLGPDEAEV